MLFQNKNEVLQTVCSVCFSSPPVRINSHLDLANHNGYDDNRPSTSKCFTSGSKILLNGAVKRRMDINTSHTSTRKMESQVDFDCINFQTLFQFCFMLFLQLLCFLAYLTLKKQNRGITFGRIFIRKRSLLSQSPFPFAVLKFSFRKIQGFGEKVQG